MCVIIIKQKKDRIQERILKASAKINPHGLGIIWLDNYQVSYHDSKHYSILDTDRPFMAHFRYATVGKVNKKNTHPFKCGHMDEYLMQNGTIYGMGNEEVCDTKCLADTLTSIPRQEWKMELAQYDCRFTTVNVRKKSFEIYNKEDWYKHEGVWYSKDNVLQVNVIAVYGTLKQGQGNYYSYLQSSKRIGAGTTKHKYPLLIDGLPYLVDKKGIGHNVEVDVFRVSPSTFAEIDALERHPEWYKRKQIPIKMTKSGKTTMAWIYFNPKEITAKTKFHKTYQTQTHSWYSGYSRSPMYNQWDWYDGYGGMQCSNRWDEVEEETEAKPIQRKKYCTTCYDELQHDEFCNYCCTRCGEWYTEKEVELME
tara:strand:- start:323 stop:1420 length:1098 start_codon:yes stop_codon:yes gene_type:complete